MATKRMFSKDIVRTDKFLDMSLSTQALYFHLCLDADAKGFVTPRSIMRLINATNDDLNVLVTKGFVIPFESGVVVITDWKVHNYIDEKREAKTQFINEFSKLIQQPQGNYQLLENSQSTLGEIRLDKIRLDKINIYVPPEGGTPISNWKDEYGDIFISAFNKLFNREFRLTPARKKKLKDRFNTYTKEEISTALINLSKSKFHNGNNDTGWRADPDFLIRSDEQIDKFINLKGNSYEK